MMTTALPGGPIADALRSAIRRYLAVHAEATALTELSGATEPPSRDLDAAEQTAWEQTDAVGSAVAKLVLVANRIDVASLGRGRTYPNAAVAAEGRLWIARRCLDSDAIGRDDDDAMYLTVVDLANVAVLVGEAAR